MNMANEKIVGETAITEVLTLMKTKDKALETAIGTNANNISYLSGDVSGLSNRMNIAEGGISTNSNAIGTLAGLSTTVKTDLVSAVNEVVGNVANNASAINTINNTTIPTLSLKSETGYKIDLEIDSDYKLTSKLYTKDNTLLSTSTVIDLPIESMIVNASYDNQTKDLTLTLQNGNTIVVPLDDIISGLQPEITSSNKLSSDLVDDTNNTNKFVTSSDKTNWNAKYNLPIGGIPKTDLASDVQTSLGLADTALQSFIETDPVFTASPAYGITSQDIIDWDAKADVSDIPTKTSDLDNDSGFITGMTILKYGTSTWNDFITAYNANKVVYCRASSNANPATGSQTRLAFMAYVNNETTPTSVEFQYYRSVSSHSATQQGDQVFVYTLKNTSGGTWSVTTRETMANVDVAGGLTRSYSGNKLTISGADKQDTLVSGTNIKTINNTSLLGSGDISIVGGQTIQYDTVPTASSSNEGQIIQYTGTTDSTYTNGYFYQCISDGEPTPTYSWINVNVEKPEVAISTTQPTNGEKIWIDPTKDLTPATPTPASNEIAVLSGTYDNEELNIIIPYPTGFTKDNCVIISYMYKYSNNWTLYRFNQMNNDEVWDLLELVTNGVALYGLYANLNSRDFDYKIVLMKIS